MTLAVFSILDAHSITVINQNVQSMFRFVASRYDHPQCAPHTLAKVQNRNISDIYIIFGQKTGYVGNCARTVRGYHDQFTL